MKMRHFMLLVALAPIFFATPSHGDTSLELLVKAITKVVKFWNWGDSSSGKTGQHDQVITEDGKSTGSSAPSKGKVVRDTARRSLESAKGAFQGSEEQEVRKKEDPAVWAEAMEAARKRGEEEVLQKPRMGGKERDGQSETDPGTP